MKLTSKGQVTVPQAFREKFGLHPHSEVLFVEKNGNLVLQPAVSKKDKVRRWIQQARGKGNTGMTTRQILSITRGTP